MRVSNRQTANRFDRRLCIAAYGESNGILGCSTMGGHLEGGGGGCRNTFLRGER